MAFNRKFTRKNADGTEDKRKIKSSKVEQDGIVFDSKLENYFYNLLKENNIEFEFKKSFQLLPSFTYRHETVLGMKITPDFFIPSHNLICDTKGFGNETVPLRYKMLKHHLHLEGTEYRIEMPSSQTKCRAIIEQIKNGWVLQDQLTEHAATARKNKLKKAGWIWHDGYWTKGDVHIPASKIMSLPVYEFTELLNNQLSLL